MRASEAEIRKWEAYYSGLPLVEPDDATRLFNSAFADAVSELLPQGGRVLEAGSGGGWQSLALAEDGRFEVTLLDFSSQALAYAQRVFEGHGRSARLIHGNAFDPGKDEYDLVFNVGVLEHYSDADQAQLLKAMASRSRKYVLPLLPNRNCYWYWLWRLRLASRGDWMWGREVPLSGLSPIFTAAGLRCAGHAYFGESWTEHFLTSITSGDPQSAAELLELHRSPAIPASQKAYLIGALGLKENVSVPARWTPVEEAYPDTATYQAALVDALAVRLAGERQILRAEALVGELRAASDDQMATARAQHLQELELEKERWATLISDQTRQLASLRSVIEAAPKIADQSRLDFDQQLIDLERARRESEILSSSLEQARQETGHWRQEAERIEKQRTEDRVLIDCEKAIAEQRVQRSLETAERIRQSATAAFSGYAELLQSALGTYRSQRAWRMMIGVREAYTRWTRRGVAGKISALRILFECLLGRYRGSDEFDIVIPDPLHQLPPDFDTPISEAAVHESAKPSGYDCIVLPIFDFEFRHQRPQQLALALSRSYHRIFWVSVSRTCSSGPGTYEVVRLRSNLWEIRVSGGPFDLYGGRLEDSEVSAMLASFRGLFQEFAISESAVLVQFPFWRRLALALRRDFASRVVYDLMDDWRNWTTEPLIGEFALSEERQLAGECDVLMVTAAEFMERYAENRPTPVLVPNGADYDFFQSVPNGPRRLEGNNIPIIGYYGAISSWFDIELLAAVARSRPAYNFVLIGAVHKVDVRPLQELPNVKFLGEKNYRELPAYLSEFDVCLIPFRINRLTKAVDPVKFYEYLSRAKPVVATPMPELLPHKELLYLAGGAVDFAHAIDRALGEGENDGALRERRLRFARENDWVHRAGAMDRAVSDTFPLVSVLVVTYNSSAFIPPFGESIIRESSYPNFEVICVDNCSDDDTVEQLMEFSRRDPRFRVRVAPKNLGFAGGNNLAARMAQGEYLVFLNPDTIVTRGWIGRLLNPLIHDSSVGMAAPVTNFSGNETKVNWDYRNLAGLQKFAEDRARRHFGESMEIPVAPLLCAMLARSLWERVGEMDERFELGMFEDDDLCLRVKKLGYRIVTAEDCFIHHFGNGSFSQLTGKENIQIFDANRKRFEQKWGTKWRPHQLRNGAKSLAVEPRLSVADMMRSDGGFQDSAPAKVPDLKRLFPAMAAVGQKINPQPDGCSALAVECENATPDTAIQFDGVILPTFYGSSTMLSATVPEELLGRPRIIEVRLVNDLGRSQPVEFTVEDNRS